MGDRLGTPGVVGFSFHKYNAERPHEYILQHMWRVITKQYSIFSVMERSEEEIDDVDEEMRQGCLSRNCKSISYIFCDFFNVLRLYKACIRPA